MNIDTGVVETLYFQPLEKTISWVMQGTVEEQAERTSTLLNILPSKSLQEINRIHWNQDFLNRTWERYIDEGNSGDVRLGEIQSLLTIHDLSPKLHTILDNKGLLILPQRVKVETHTPISVQGASFAGGILVCDDYLRYVMISRSHPFDALQQGDFNINISKFKGYLSDEANPRGKIGVVSITPKINVAFTDRPIAGNTPDSRGIMIPNMLFAVGADDPLHSAWILGVDYNMSHILSLFKQYMITGVDPSPGKSTQ